MTRLCDCGCRRPAHTEWLHPHLGDFAFGRLCTIRLAPALRAQGFDEFLLDDDRSDEEPRHTFTGGPLDADCG